MVKKTKDKLNSFQGPVFVQTVVVSQVWACSADTCTHMLTFEKNLGVQ